MPRADTLLFVLAGFLGLWSLSLVVRGIWSDRLRGRRRCPGCRVEIADRSIKRCVACGYESKLEKHFHALKLHWRMIGAGTAVLATSPAIFYAGLEVRRWANFGGVRGVSIGPWTAVAAGVILFGAAVIGRSIWGDRSRGRRRCPKCWYDMAGAPTLVCPECGHDAVEVAMLYRTRRLRRPAIIGIAVIVLGGLGLLVTPIRTGAWRAGVPTGTLIAWFESMPDSMIFPSNPLAPEADCLQRRVEIGALSQAQQRSLHATCLEILQRGASDPAFGRAIEFADSSDPRVARCLLTAAIDGLLAPTPSANPYPFLALGLYRITDLVRSDPSLSRLVDNAYPSFLTLLGNPTPAVAEAAQMLACMGDPATVVHDLIAASTSSLGSPKDVTIRTLGRLAHTSPQGRDLLIARLGDGSAANRMTALASLLDLGHFDTRWFLAPTPPAVDPIGRKTIDFFAKFRGWFDQSYNRFQNELVNDPSCPQAVFARLDAARSEMLTRLLPHVTPFLASSDAAYRGEALDQIGWMSQYATMDFSDIVPRVEALMSDPDVRVRDAAARALELIKQRREHDTPN